MRCETVEHISGSETGTERERTEVKGKRDTSEAERGTSPDSLNGDGGGSLNAQTGDDFTVERQSLLAAWRWWLPLALLSLLLALAFLDPFAGDWDALDYTVLAIEGRASSMILGRTLFLSVNHALWLVAHTVFQLSPEKAYLLFKYAVVAQTPFATVAWWWFARDLTHSARAATLAALLLALSPFYIIYSGQAMTEIPSLLLMAVALTIHLRGVRRGRLARILAGAALLGLSVNVREAALLYAPWLVLAPLVVRGTPGGWNIGRRELASTALACVVFLVCAFAPFALLLLTNMDNYRWAWHGWVESSRMESARHPVSLDNLQPLLRYFFIASPLLFSALPFAAYREWKRRGWRSPLLALAFVGLCANLSLIIHYSVVLNGRYMLTGLPALAPLVAASWLSWQSAKMQSVRRAFVSSVLGVLIIAATAAYFTWPVGRGYLAERTLAKEYRARLALVPRDAVMIAGKQTVAVTYWRGIGAGEWGVIGTGAGWPGAQLASVIERDLQTGRRVFFDADPRWWPSHGWAREELRDLAGLDTQFRFRRISETIYEVRPPEDESARDILPLSRLLSVN